MRDGVGCEQSHISGTGWSAGLSLGSPLLVHISNSSTLLCFLRATYCSTSSCPLPHPVISSLCLSPSFFSIFCLQRLHIPHLSCQKAGLGLLCIHSQVGQSSCWVTTKLPLSVQELNGSTHFVHCAAFHFQKT